MAREGVGAMAGTTGQPGHGSDVEKPARHLPWDSQLSPRPRLAQHLVTLVDPGVTFGEAS
jgi:hypothetical protein